MLILKRRVDERILIGDDIVITVITARNGEVRLGFDAPDSVVILREELKRRPMRKQP